MRKLVLLIALGALAPFAFTACGGGDDNETTATQPAQTTTQQGGGGGGGGTTLNLAADSTQLAYDTTSLSAKAGKATIDLTNPSSTPHDVCVEDSSGNQLGCSDTISGGDSTSLQVDLSQSGDYTFYCSVDGHRAAGMEGTLAVK